MHPPASFVSVFRRLFGEHLLLKLMNRASRLMLLHQKLSISTPRIKTILRAKNIGIFLAFTT